MNKDKQACKPLSSPSHFGNGTSYKLARQRANDRIRRAKQQEGQGRESLQSPLILLYSLVAIVTML